ncbi:MAG TPA: hypothetical protein VLN25_11735, partial [Burkholderiaceae bacterium]|nr:hypothetical protein [Burkholderiaceae bacterium]
MAGIREIPDTPACEPDDANAAERSAFERDAPGESDEFARALNGMEAEASDDDYEPDNVQRYL